MTLMVCYWTSNLINGLKSQVFLSLLMDYFSETHLGENSDQCQEHDLQSSSVPKNCTFTKLILLLSLKNWYSDVDMEKNCQQTEKEKKTHRETLTMQRRAILSDIKIPLHPLKEVGIVYKGETFHPPEGLKAKINNTNVIMTTILCFLVKQMSTTQ